MHTGDAPATWLHSDRFVPRRLVRPVLRRSRAESAGGVLLLAATVVALVWANSPWSGTYADVWSTRVALDVGGRTVAGDLRHWVNDGLMALFFFVVGLEIKRELVHGALADVRRAALPVVAALGGMAVPAAIYALINAGGAGSPGWGIPMATDIAFAVGVLALGARVPAGLKVLLLALAVVDDIGAIAVIAVFYSDGVAAGWVLGAGAGLLLIVGLSRVGVRATPVYAVIGTIVWFATLQSGIHATLAGVALGLLTPARTLHRRLDGVGDAAPGDAAGVRAEAAPAGEPETVAERLVRLLHPWTTCIVIPVFALANAGVTVSAAGLERAISSPITLGVVAGLVVGKFVGVTVAVGLARRARLAVLPAGVTMRHVAAMAAVAGIGFTVSLFISGLAFEGQQADEAKLGVLAASVLAGGAGTLLLRRAAADDVAGGDGQGR